MNLFRVTNGTLKTPPAYAGFWRGVTRDAVIEVARARRPTQIEELPAEPLRPVHGRRDVLDAASERARPRREGIWQRVRPRWA